MKLKDLINCELGKSLCALEIKGVTCNSRNVREGFAFVCIKGDTVDGHRPPRARWGGASGKNVRVKSFPPWNIMFPLVGTPVQPKLPGGLYPIGGLPVEPITWSINTLDIRNTSKCMFLYKHYIRFSLCNKVPGVILMEVLSRCSLVNEVFARYWRWESLRFMPH